MNSAKIEKSNRKYDIKALNQRMYQIIKSNPDVPRKNAPTLQIYIFKNIRFIVFKFSTVI